ncbi:MAG: thiol:disulfide interchange protein, partial [Oleibacter sp.]|nr:thiol:disulfide interchange protein [Thalassolituus sp.]
VSAPLAGALVYISTTGDAFTGFAALLALGLGMGTPLIILGTTGASVLPKAGGWMNQIKVFFGILLLAVAVWLLSRILPGSISLLLWALLAIIYAVVLGAFEAAASTAQRVIKGIAWVLLLYGVMALAGALMGNSNPLQPLQLTGSFSSAATAASESSLFYRTESVTDIEQKIASAKGPVMLDLYADWCISCKVMEDEIFAQSDVQQRLSHVMWLQLDVTENSQQQIDFMQSHAIFGPPTILFFDNAKELQQMRITGELGKAEFNQRTSAL